MSERWWRKTSGRGLAQGDLLPDCLLPVFAGAEMGESEDIVEEDIISGRLIIMTQSCDLENKKARFVAMCPIHQLSEWEEVNPKYKKSGEWDNVRKRRVEGLHLLASPDTPSRNRDSLVVDFGHIVSLPVEYLSSHAEFLGDRWRLESPFLEPFSQAFARFFMRVGLPSGIPPFK